MSYALATRSSAFDRFLSEAFNNSYAGRKVTQDEKSWTFTLDVPGVAREHLSIDIKGAEVHIGTDKEAARQYRFAYELPEEIDADATTAKLENGVLTLTLGKKAPNVRKIAVA